MLIAVGLAGVGGGRGWTFSDGAVATRRSGGGCRTGEVEWGGGGAWFPAVVEVVLEAEAAAAGKHGDEADANDASCCDSLDGLVVGCCC